jgi:LytR cell envelope-related transcriptional attenuator
MRSVEHAYAVSLSRWRTATIVASALAAAELVALAAIGATMLAHTVKRNVQQAAVQKVAGPAPAHPSARTERTILARGDTGVLVLNANGIAGAAATAASSLRARGYIVSGVGNADSQGTTRTMVMYRGSFLPEARRLARDVGGAAVTPLDGIKPSELMGAQVALVLGS